VWKTISKVCGAVGVVMSAMQIGLIGILPDVAAKVYVAVQTGVIALGLYCGTIKENGETAE
jgi:hypothetical protein